MEKMHKKRRLDRRDYIVILVLGIAVAAAAAVYTRFDYVFGAKLDWSDQHFAIPDYLRKLAYETGELFPSFAPNIGAGENIYYLSYYGLLSPVILLSYLMPFVSMAVYIQVSSLVLCWLGTALFYRFMRKRRGFAGSLLLTAAYLTASPIFFQAHRHIMFVSYMPFLILALEAVDDYFESRRSGRLILFCFLIIMTNWFYSVAALAAVTVYAVYRYLSMSGEFGIGAFGKAAAGFALRMVTAVLCAGVLLLPTVHVLLSGRDKSNSGITLRDLIPNISTEAIGYSPYAMGLGAFAVLAVVCAVMDGKNRARRFMGIVFAAVSCLPVITYILNGTMYIEAKVYIPFIPLILLLCGDLLDELGKSQLRLSRVIVFGAVIAVSTVGGVMHMTDNYVSIAKLGMLIDSVILAVCAMLYYIKGLRAPMKASLLIMPVFLFIPLNLVDKPVSREQLQKMTEPAYAALSRTAYERSGLWRTALAEQRADNVNTIPDSSFFSAYIYSSLHHKGYNDFYFNYMHNENEFRNSALTTRSQNPFFAVFMGERYLISGSEVPPFGYETAASAGGYYLYENQNVLPVGRGCPALGEDVFDSLGSAEQMEALCSRVITGSGGSFEGSISDCGLIDLPHSSAITRTDSGWRVTSAEKLTLTAPLGIEVPQDKVLILEMTCDNTVGERKDSRVTINGIRNTLTDPDWKYYNNNTTFTYVLTPCSELRFVFTAGDYALGELHAWLADYPDPDCDPLVIDKDSTRGDTLAGTIDCRSDEYFELSVPYDEGFSVTVDGEEQQLECVDKTFIGFPIKAGSHRIEVRFTAPMLGAGKAASLIGLAGLLITVLAESRQRRRLRTASLPAREDPRAREEQE